ncbi:hypothetical protein HAU87_09620 [Weissella confusa]|uniref:hypothetical protein n=1 Tax=Weissella confusa TaxID=1583 RepID=UPI0018F120E0|nr:hypothetical protein [Weissella confusa]MBJ7678500.1 hypothetical protein [Weissella confusa]
MRLLVVDLGELRQGNVDWQLFVENLLDGGVETVVLLNATQHASAGAPVFFGNGIHVFDVGRHVIVVPTVSGRGEGRPVEMIESTHDYLHGQLKPMFMLPPEQWLYRLRDYDWVRCDDLAQQRVQSMGDEIPVVVDYDAAIVSIEPWQPLLDTPFKTSLIHTLD